MRISARLVLYLYYKRMFFKHKLSFFQQKSAIIAGAPDVSRIETLCDDKWHHIEARVKMNSTVGVNDGVREVYFDGTLQTKQNNVPWRMASIKDTVTDFNMIIIGGNSHNVWVRQTNEEQWMYDVNDLNICTTRCPGPGAAPKPPTIQQ